MGRAGLIAAVVLSVATSLRLAAQAPAPVRIAALPADVAAGATFDVVSIKVNRSGNGPVMTGGGVGRYNATNAPLTTLIRAAYRLQANQIEGLPAWASSTRFDVVATIPPGPPAPERQMAMLRNMLKDRFKLTANTAVREMPLYALQIARADGRLGEKMKPPAVDCVAMNAGRGGGQRAPGAQPACGLMVGPGRIVSSGQSAAGIVTAVSVFADRLVVDRTGLQGFYEFELLWTPEQFAGRGGRDGGPIIANGVEIDPNGPSLFTAIQEQLGLKLEPTRGPVEVLVIDRVEPPTED